METTTQTTTTTTQTTIHPIQTTREPIQVPMPWWPMEPQKNRNLPTQTTLATTKPIPPRLPLPRLPIHLLPSCEGHSPTILPLENMSCEACGIMKIQTCFLRNDLNYYGPCEPTKMSNNYLWMENFMDPFPWPICI